MNVNKLSVVKNFCGLLILGIFAVSCRQDPIFYTISTETVPKPPLIRGAPTNMVLFERKGTLILYVASGRIHWYAKATGADKPEWNLDEYAIPQPKENIISIAVTGKRLYALCLNGNSLNSTLYFIGHDDNEWTPIHPGENNYLFIQSIYADPGTDQLFAGTRENNALTSYAILYLDNTDDTLKLLKDKTAILSGACYQSGYYYLCTRSNGIFRVPGTKDGVTETTATSLGNNLLMFMGMIKLEDDSIIAVERRGGALYQIKNGSLEQMRNNSGDITTGKYATGALARWENPIHDMKMLIAGIQGGLYSTTTSSYTHGYVEFDLMYPDGSFNANSPRRDSGNLLSIDNNDRYTASIGKRPINHLFQAPEEIDPDMTFFASTQANGLWSYRYRPNNGGWQWNAESADDFRQ